MFALVRSNFGVSPESLSDDKFARLCAEAIWLEEYKANVMKGAIAEVMIKMFKESSE